MKKLILTIFAISVTLISIAQRPFATLEHEGTVTVYYGTTALSQAHSAAVTGDIITLSPGMFTAVNITKAITLRGAGMFADTVTGTTPTYISGAFTFSAPNDTLHYLSFEGLYFMDEVKYGSVYNPMFSKCMFHTELGHATATNNTTYMRDATFVNCIVRQWRNYLYSGTNQSIYTASGTTFLNSVILNDVCNESRDILTNCIVVLDPYYCDYRVINNCILYTGYHSGSVNDAITSWNSIGITTNNDHKYFNPSILSTHGLHNKYGYSSVFKYFDGTYIDGMSFELQDNIANTILGNDGTQVGIYGGAHPFNPRVQNYKITVPSESNASGQLPVTIQAANEN